jgi:hypothetical protein
MTAPLRLAHDGGGERGWGAVLRASGATRRGVGETAERGIVLASMSRLPLRPLVAGALLATLVACGTSPTPEFESTCVPLEVFAGRGGEGGASLGRGGTSGAQAVNGGAAGGMVTGDAGVQQRPVAANRITSDAYVGDVEVALHDRVRTILVVTWDQLQAADEVWLEFGLAGEAALWSRPAPGARGPHRDVVLGVPGSSDVTVRVVSRVGGTAYESSAHQARTGAIPSGMPRPEILSYDSELASPYRWLFGSVEDSFGGGPNAYYAGTFWLYIIDRRGRIVWYYADPASNATTSFQRRARDGGEYIVLEKRCFGCSGYDESVVKMTLDWEYFEQIPVPGLADCIDVTDDGSVLYDAQNELRERTADGETRFIWSCRDHFGSGFDCYSNTVNWVPARNTVLLSYPYENVVVEIDRETGELVGQYGIRAGSFDFAPPARTPPEAWGFSFQHFPNWSPTGTLMISTHLPGCSPNQPPAPYQHAFLEFEIDRTSETLIEQWRYTEGTEWPRAKGMAIRLPGGNTLANYGTGGVIREITPNHYTAWHVKFDVDEGSDFYNKMVGHNEFVDDLYSLNGGPAAMP